MARSMKMSALLAAAGMVAAFAGGVQAQVASNEDLTEVRKMLEKAGVKDAAKLPVMPVTAAAFFKASGQNTQAMMKAYEEAAKQIPTGGGNR